MFKKLFLIPSIYVFLVASFWVVIQSSAVCDNPINGSVWLVMSRNLIHVCFSLHQLSLRFDFQPHGIAKIMPDFLLLIDRIFGVVARKGSQWSLSSSRYTVVTSVLLQGTWILTIFHSYPTGRENLKFCGEGNSHFICLSVCHFIYRRLDMCNTTRVRSTPSRKNL